MGGAFIGALGLFNSSKLELRQLSNTNTELLFQNGQIISAAMIGVCMAGILGEVLFMKSRNNLKLSLKLATQSSSKEDNIVMEQNPSKTEEEEEEEEYVKI